MQWRNLSYLFNRVSLALAARRSVRKKNFCVYSGFASAKARFLHLKFFLIPTKRKFQLRLETWSVLSCEVNTPKKRRFISAQNDNGAKPSQEPSKNIAAEISPLHISFCLFSKFSSSINFYF